MCRVICKFYLIRSKLNPNMVSLVRYFLFKIVEIIHSLSLLTKELGSSRYFWALPIMYSTFWLTRPIRFAFPIYWSKRYISLHPTSLFSFQPHLQCIYILCVTSLLATFFYSLLSPTLFVFHFSSNVSSKSSPFVFSSLLGVHTSKTCYSLFDAPL